MEWECWLHKVKPHQFQFFKTRKNLLSGILPKLRFKLNVSLPAALLCNFLHRLSMAHMGFDIKN